MKNKERLKLISILIVIVFIFIITLFGQKLAPNDPDVTNLSNALKKPSLDYLFGTDSLGRCIFSRILVGAYTTVISSLIVVVIVFIIGITLGILAGYLGGICDSILMKITTVFQAFPSFILAIAVAGTLGIGIRNSIISLCVVYWTTYARLSRSMVLSIKESTYIKAAKLCGANKFQIMIRYIFPNIVAPLVVTATLDIGTTILNLAGLSFLGLGAERPTAEWGAMMSEAKQCMQTAPWALIFPGLAIFFVVVSFNLLGDRIRDELKVNSMSS